MIRENYMQIVYESNSYLCHHGVKGMKWGHRKQRYAQKQINRYGSKKEAVAALTRKADRGANARKMVKKGAGYATALLSGTHVANTLLSAAALSQFTNAGIGITTTAIASIGAASAIPFLGLGAAGLAVGMKAKAKHSSKKKKQIETVQNYNKRA